MDFLRERLIEALDSAGRQPEQQRDGWVRYRCAEHEDHVPSAYLGERGFFCFSCEAKGSFKALAERLLLPVGIIELHEWRRTHEPELRRRAHERDAQRHRDRRLRRDAVQRIWPRLEMTEQGLWYLREHRGIDGQFAEAYGVRSFTAGCWPVGELVPPGPIRRRGGLIIPYFLDPGELPVSFRVRAALPDQFTKCPAHIKSIAKMAGKKTTAFWSEPARYWAPRGHSGLIFNEVALRTEGAIDALWVAEGEIDALSLIQQGFTAVGLPGMTNGWERLRYYVERRSDIAAINLVPDDEPRAITLFTDKARHLRLVTTATIRVMRSKGSDLDAGLRASQ